MSAPRATGPRSLSALARIAFGVWAAVTLVLVTALALVLGRLGAEGFYRFQVAGHGGTVELNFAAFCASWLALGGLLGLCRAPAFARRHAFFLAVLTLVGFAWLNAVREPHRVVDGDFGAYFEAARALHAGEPIVQLPDRLYLYPPLLATVLSPLVPLGYDAVLPIFHFANFLALLAVVVALYAALQRYRFERELAALAVLVVFTTNVPILRTLAYHQVNLWVEALVLASFLAAPRRPALSALCLALATHLKVYPALLVLPWLWLRDVRWLGLYALSNLAIVAGTSLANGFSHYLVFLHQAAGLQETALRNASIDAFVYNTLRIAGLYTGGIARPFSLGLRLVFTGALLDAWRRMGDRPLLADGPPPARRLANGFALLPLPMLAISPSIWEHHPVLLLLTFPVLASALRDAADLLLFLPAYGFLFWMPVFDIYPVSGLRLLAFGLLLALVLRLTVRRESGAPPWLARLNNGLRALVGEVSGDARALASARAPESR
ncbi:MAG TPA: glycosyltransferase family 87 protein [Myxococcota bacterium]|jgi:hypothetical protein|nr:glycosyltransferase family 87 protein [Myxococcota bacterium]